MTLAGFSQSGSHMCILKMVSTVLWETFPLVDAALNTVVSVSTTASVVYLLLILTGLGYEGRVLAHAGIFTESAEVLAVDAEHVLVCHDQVRDGAVGAAIVLIHRKPLLRVRALHMRKSLTQKQKFCHHLFPLMSFQPYIDGCCWITKTVGRMLILLVWSHTGVRERFE